MGTRASILLCAALVAFAVAGCAGAPESGGGDAGSSGGAPATTRQPAEILETECTKCHSLDRIDGITDRDQTAWESTVRRMVSRGASLTDAEVTALAAYLAAR